MVISACPNKRCRRPGLSYAENQLLMKGYGLGGGEIQWVSRVIFTLNTTRI